MDLFDVLLAKQLGGGGSSVTIEGLNVTENGTYTASEGYAYSPVSVNVQSGGDRSQENGLVERNISGTYSNSEVTKVGIYAFMECTKLESVNLPNVTKIVSQAFYRCVSMTNVSIPNLTEISGSSAFAQCSKLTSVDFPKLSSVSLQTSSVFEKCYALATVNMPKLNIVPDKFFLSCSALQYVDLPAAVFVGQSAFFSCINMSYINSVIVR